MNTHKNISNEDLKLYETLAPVIKRGRRSQISLSKEEQELQDKLISIHKKLRRQQSNAKWLKIGDNKYKSKVLQLIRRNRNKLNEEQINEIKKIEDKQVAFKTLYKILHPDIY